MKLLLYGSIGLGSLWLQLTLAPAIALGIAKPNLLLLSVVLTGLRWKEPWLFVFAAMAGVSQDVFSHGTIGVYGISHFAVAFCATQVGKSTYEGNLFFIMVAVFGLCLLEGLISVTLLQLLEPDVPWWQWVFLRVIPVSLYSAVLSPLPFFGLIWLERRIRLYQT